MFKIFSWDIKVFYLLSGALWLFSSICNADEPLLFIVNDPGSAPYLFYDKAKQNYIGVIPDVLQALIDNKQLNIRFVSNRRKRSEEQLYQQQADMMMLSTAWLKQPDQVIATIPIHQHRSFLYRTTPFPENFSLEHGNKKETLCTRKDYRYPNLAQYFNNKRLLRIDVSNHLSMMKMLLKQRCDYTVMNEFNALSVMNSAEMKQYQVYRSNEPISVVALNIILRAPLTEEKKLLDKHIEHFRTSGEIQRLINKYTHYLK